MDSLLIACETIESSSLVRWEITMDRFLVACESTVTALLALRYDCVPLAYGM